MKLYPRRRLILKSISELRLSIKNPHMIFDQGFAMHNDIISNISFEL